MIKGFAKAQKWSKCHTFWLYWEIILRCWQA